MIVHAEELAGVVSSYERRGYFDEILGLMEAGLSLERAHVRQNHVLQIFTDILQDGYLHRTVDSVQQIPTGKVYVYQSRELLPYSLLLDSDGALEALCLTYQYTQSSFLQLI